jgi:Xaa-Pro aminopeptidase
MAAGGLTMNVHHSATATSGLSLRERDNRYAAIRAELAKRGLKGLIVQGTHLLYLSNGVPGEMLGFLPTQSDLPFTEILMWRYLADVEKGVVLDHHPWISDLRSGRDAMALVERLQEIGVTEGKLGYAGSLTARSAGQIKKSLPGIELIDATEIMINARTIKSAEEIALMEKANRIFDAAIKEVHKKARPGMLGRDIDAIARTAMWAAGGDSESYGKFSFGPVGTQNPIMAEICMDREIQDGDIGILTAHAHFQHYAGHSDQVFAFGTPNPIHLEMFDAVIQVRDEVMKAVRPGATHRELVDVYEQATAKTGFKTSPHSQMHLYGLDVPEFPGPAFKIGDTKGGAGLGGSGNFTLTEGMIYSISPTLINAVTGDLILGGTSLVVTGNGYRNLSDRKVELLVAG